MKKNYLGWGAVAVGTALMAQAIAPLALAAAPASITIDASHGSTPYSQLLVSGSGFMPNESVQIIFGTSRATATADGDGNFAGAALAVPNVATGSYIILAYGQTSGDIAYSYFFVGAFYPLVAPSTWWTPPGSTITFSGSGFSPSEQITITLSGSSTPFAMFSTDANGSFSSQGSFVIPFSLRNSNASFVVKSASSGYSNTLTIGVSNLYPWVNPSAWYILPGNTVTFSGGGFGPGEGVSIYYGTSTTLLAHATADSTGAFTSNTPVMVPYGTGAANFEVVGDQSGLTVSAPITRANFYPNLTPSAYYSAPGGMITIGGTGFAPNETVLITAGSSASTTATTDGSGAFTPVSVQLPSISNTQVPVTATGETSGATASFQMTMGQYYTWVVLSSYWTQGGTPLTVTGHNFAPNEMVTLSAGGTPFATTTANGSGDFTAMTTVPYLQPGPITIVATGATSATPASVGMTVAPVWTNLQLKSYAGAPGDPIEFIGSGYDPNDIIQVTTASTTLGTINADGSGSFDATLAGPSSWAPGNFPVTLTVIGTRSFDTKSIVYYVTGS